MKETRPVHYKILLEPDLESFHFSGRTEIVLEASVPETEITLNALDLDVRACRVRGDQDAVECTFSLDPDREELSVRLPGEMSGQIVLQIDYTGKINDRMAGFYRSRYVDQGREGWLAVTQFEESDARRAFPCFDHPVWKAVFDVEMVVPENLAAISNGPVTEVTPLGEGKKRVKFLQTPRMSTYLLFFAVGPFEFLEDPGEEVLVRAATTPGMTHLAKFGLDFGRKSLEYCENYYGIKYPLPKLDLIAVADFAFGAMENWGAITFRENLILHDPETTSRAGEQRICEVIAHEMAHQWFGNLVSPSDWKYLWLNESFATYFGFGVVDHYHPDWGVWDQFLHTQTERALYRDALQETFPIEIPGGAHVVINEVTAPIIYSKGASILRQVEGYIGQEGFQKGLQLYLNRHKFECASSHHLWEALEETSNSPVTNLMKNWVEQPGHPLLEVRREGNRLELKQCRFTFLPTESSQRWLIPVRVRVFYKDRDEQILTTLMEGDTAEVLLGDGALAYKVNAGQTGFYRVRYCEKDDLRELGIRVAGRALPPEDRWGIQGDLFALVLTGGIPLREYLEFLSCYEKEEAFLPLVGIADNLYQAHLILEGGAREKVAHTGKAILERVLERIGLEPDPEEKHTTSALRDQILFHAALYGSEQVQRFGLKKFSSLKKGGSVHADISKSVMQVGALYGGGEALDWLAERYQAAESEHERINILFALGSFRDRDMVEKALRHILDRVPERNKFMPLCRVAANPYATPFLWEWFVSHLNTLEQLHPVHYERVLGAIVPFSGLGREEEVVAFLEKYMQQEDRAKDAIKMSLERLEINRRLRASCTETS